LKATNRSAVDRARRAGQFILDALSGRLGILMMTLAYAVFAVVLLAYVSTQVYTNSLMEDISARMTEQRELKDSIGRLTAEYAALASRIRVSDYCEKKLSMIEADGDQVIRVAVDAENSFSSTRPFTGEPVRVSDVLGSEIGELTEVMRR
jgi:cell division protein FtsL